MSTQGIEIKAGHEILRGNLYLAEKPKKLAVLFLHGWTGIPNEAAAKLLAKNGCSAMTISLSGHNKSSGKLEDQSRAKSLAEILAVYDLFVAKLPKQTKIGVAGNSYGGYFAAILNTKRPVSFIQMRVPANYPDERWNDKQLGQSEEITDWRRQKLESAENKALNSINKFRGPVQILEAELDERVPHQTVQNYVDAVTDKSKLEYHFLKGWPHSMGLDKERNQLYQQLTLNWLNKISEQI